MAFSCVWPRAADIASFKFEAIPERGGAYMCVRATNGTIIAEWADESSNFTVRR
jgi:hypothetical protein